jgi:catechol 2,3-dioxygenase-like lactoylglutathione lyase family enzyme
MPRLDHVAVESANPAGTARFYERFLGARIVRTEGHPVMAYLQQGAVAIHAAGPHGHGRHMGFRVSHEERAALKRALDEAGVANEERDHGVGVGLFFSDPDGRQLEAITYRDSPGTCR